MESTPLAEGQQVLGRYEIMATAGQGGMGTVYCARCLQTGGLVALKVLSHAGERPEEAERFLREARILQSLQSLQHPAIVSYIEHGVLENGSQFLVMEWLDGEDLATYLARTSLTLQQSLTVARRAASALAAAHGIGIVHRDRSTKNKFCHRSGYVALPRGARTTTSYRATRARRSRTPAAPRLKMSPY
jgi:serine/threonine protein kinase